MSLLLALTGGSSAVDYALDCETGSYTLSGQDAVLTYAPAATNYAMDCAPGAYALSGGNATLAYVSGSSAKSGVSRQWLIGYYTEAFKKPVVQVAEPKLKHRAITKRRAEQVAQQHEQEIEQRIERMVQQAERDVAKLTAQAGDAVAAQQMIQALLQNALQSQNTITDFMLIAKNYQQQVQREDSDLLLLAIVL